LAYLSNILERQSQVLVSQIVEEDDGDTAIILIKSSEVPRLKEGINSIIRKEE
jgi:hypothetical protein